MFTQEGHYECPIGNFGSGDMNDQLRVIKDTSLGRLTRSSLSQGSLLAIPACYSSMSESSFTVPPPPLLRRGVTIPLPLQYREEVTLNPILLSAHSGGAVAISWNVQSPVAAARLYTSGPPNWKRQPATSPGVTSMTMRIAGCETVIIAHPSHASNNVLNVMDVMMAVYAITSGWRSNWYWGGLIESQEEREVWIVTLNRLQ